MFSVPRRIHARGAERRLNASTAAAAELAQIVVVGRKDYRGFARPRLESAAIALHRAVEVIEISKQKVGELPAS